MSNWYQLDSNETLRQLGVDAAHGLSGAAAAARLTRYGPNELVERGLKSP